MSDVVHEQIKANDITLHVATSGPLDGPPVVLCHGFPELWYSWRHQLDALGDEGYRVLAPDLRGYGASSRPTGDPAAYGSDHVTADLCGMLDHYGYEQSAFVGHDWGSLAVWEMGKLHADRVASILNMSVPFSPPPSSAPTERLETIFADKFFYILYFQPVGPAEHELEADPRRFLGNFFYSAGGEGRADSRPMSSYPREGTGLLDTLQDAPSPPAAWMTEDDLEVYVDAFTETGFFGPLSYYRNLDANWARTKDVPAARLAMPTAFLTGSLDPVQGMFPKAQEMMETVLPDFRGTTVIEGAGHWVQQERPDEVNAALLAFLDATR